jgi:hypothetical protein
MRKLSKLFDEIWASAEQRNEREGGQRFFRIYQQNKRYITVGIYDGLTKKYCMFDTINLSGNFRYNSRVVPPEFDEMARMVRQ